MRQDDRIEKLFNIMLADAGEAFESTGRYCLLREKLDQMERDCAGMFDDREHQFARECFAMLDDYSSCRERHIYRRGLLDCVSVLKALRVLA